MNSTPFGVSQYTTWPQSFGQDLELYREAGVDFIEVCEAKLDAVNPEPQPWALQDSGLRVSSVQPRLHSLFPDFPRPEPQSPRERDPSVPRALADIVLNGLDKDPARRPPSAGAFATKLRAAARSFRSASKM